MVSYDLLDNLLTIGGMLKNEMLKNSLVSNRKEL